MKKKYGSEYEAELTNFVIRNANNIGRWAALDDNSIGDEAKRKNAESLANTDTIIYLSRQGAEDTAIKNEYESKIIFDYQLSKFREDGYSKEIKTLRSDLYVEERALQAMILSQYRYKVFQSYRQNIKPVVFFKS